MTVEDRIAIKIKVAGECREWTGCLHSRTLEARYRQGRPIILSDKRSAYVSRVVWALAFGPIPNGLCVLHTCDNPRCLRTLHLFLGTRSDNHRDMVRKGRLYHIPPRRGEQNNLAKLTTAQVQEIRARSGVVPKLILAREYGVTRALISMIINNKVWKHI